MLKELSGVSEPNPFIMSWTQNFQMLMYCPIYYIMHTKCIPHIYYTVHTELSGASEPCIFIILTTQNCQVLMNHTHLFIILCSQKCQVLVKQIHLLYYAHKIWLQILQDNKHFAEWRCRWENNVSDFNVTRFKRNLMWRCWLDLSG